MISGFIGTAISLERTVALRRWWAHIAATLSAVGLRFLLAGASMMAAGSVVLTVS